MQIRLDVWQFVRLMVALETRLGGTESGHGSDAKAFYDRWEDLWVDLDARLVDMGRTDRVAFADIMMDQEVILEDVRHGELQVAIIAFKKVLDQLRLALQRTDEPAETADLSFERDEIALTLERLQTLAGAPPPAASPTAPFPGPGP